MTPQRLEIRDNGRILRVFWPNGTVDELGAAFLRSECRSAGARREQIDHGPISTTDIRIIAVHPIGAYAVNIVFSDGQDRGIYPWPFLAELAERAPSRLVHSI